VLLVDSFAPHRGWLPIDPDAISPGKRDIMWAEVDVDTLESHDGELLAEVFGIDGQTLQTALDPRHRPKLETLADRRFLVLHELNERNGRLQPSQIACFFADDEVIVVHSSATRTLEAARELREQLGEELDANQLVGCILKVLVDDYQMIADRMHGDIGPRGHCARNGGCSHSAPALSHQSANQQAQLLRRPTREGGHRLHALGRRIGGAP